MDAATPGGRWIVTWLTSRTASHRMVSVGCGSSGSETQLVAGLPSKTERGWSCGSGVYVDDAVTLASRRPSRAYLSATEELIKVAEP